MKATKKDVQNSVMFFAKKINKNLIMENIKANFLCGVGIENVDVVDLETAKHIKKTWFQ